MNRKTTFAVSLALCLSGCASSNGEEDKKPEPVALVSLTPAGSGNIEQSITLYGEIERGGDSQIVLAAPIEATVVAIDAPAGSAVRSGQVIARLKASPASLAQLRAAEADATAARQALARMQRLRTDGLASDPEVEAARSRAVAASALLESYHQRGSALLLRAPHDGYVDATGASAGDLVQAGTAIATLSRTGGSKARFGIDPANARRLARDAAVQIIPADGSPPFTARITSISPTANMQTRLASVLVSIPPGRGLATGQPLSARVIVQASQAAVTIPYVAVLDDGGQPFVYVVKDGVAHRRDVEIGAVDAENVAITKGMARGEVVVSAGGAGVADGMKVRVK